MTNPEKSELSHRQAVDILIRSGMNQSRARWAVNGADPINTNDNDSHLRYTPEAIQTELKRLVIGAQEDADRANKTLSEYRNAIEEFCKCQNHD
jgi:hypothetical protein